MRKFILLILMLLILTPLSLKADEKIKIVATIPPLASIAREIAGDRAEVYYIIPTNSDPHQYSLSPRDVSLAESSDLFISVGTEPFIKKLNVRRALSWDDWIKAGIVVKDDNPHYLWLYPENAVKIAETIERKLEEIDPLGKDYYRANLEKFKGSIKELMSWIYSYTSNIRGSCVLLAGSHFSPIADVMGLKVAGILIRGEGKLPSPEDLKSFEENGTRNNARVIIVLATQKESDEGRLAETVSSDTGIPIAYAYGVMFSGNDTYEEFIKYTVAGIKAAVESSRPTGKQDYLCPVAVIVLLAALVISWVRWLSSRK
jgi:zinc transport system substrate-binding protein